MSSILNLFELSDSKSAYLFFIIKVCIKITSFACLLILRVNELKYIHVSPYNG